MEITPKANRLRELCAAFDESDPDGLRDNAQEVLWRAYDLMDETCSALDDAGRDGEDGTILAACGESPGSGSTGSI